MWTIASEASHCIANCDYVLCIIHVSVGHVCSTGPGCVARISVALSFGEQPDSGTPRYIYSWLKVWFYDLDNQYGKYIMVDISCSFIKNGNFCQCWFNYLCISCDCFLCQSPVSRGDGVSTLPGCVARMSVAPSSGEQPDPGTPGCSYEWLERSMMRTVNTVTAFRLFLMQFWCFKFKVLSGLVVFVMSVSLAKANGGLMRKRNKVWFYELERQYGFYTPVRPSTDHPIQWRPDNFGTKDLKWRLIVQYIWIRLR